jgi:hypothetical protein
MMKFQAASLVACSMLVFGLIGCGQKLQGVYKDDLGLQTYEFKNNGVVYISTMGILKESHYELDNQKVKIIQDNDINVYDIRDDGSIKGPLGMSLKLQPEEASNITPVNY